MKKHGNTSAHSSSASKNGKLALECLERAYEISIFYSNVKYGYNKKLDKTVFSEELLMTGKNTGKKSSPKLLKEKYSDELKKSRAKSSNAQPKKTKKTGRKQKSKNKNKRKIFQIIIVITLIALVYLFLNIRNR